MSFPLFGLAIAAGAIIIGSAAAWFCEELTEEEKSKQEELILKKNIINEQFSNIQNIDLFHHKLEINTLNLQLKELSDIYIIQVNEFRYKKRNIYESIEGMSEIVKKEILRKDISFHHYRALLSEKRRVEDAKYRLDAYFDYLDWYEKEVKYLNDRNLMESLRDLDIPRALLPEDYLHVGMICYITHDDVDRYLNRNNKFGLKLILDDYKELKDQFPEEIPLLITGKQKVSINSYCASIAKGELYLNYLYNEPPVPFEVECLEYKGWGNYVCYKSLGQKIDGKYYNELKLLNSNKIAPLKKYYPGDKFEVYPINWDLLLKGIEVSEKIPENNNINSVIPILYNSTTEYENLLVELEEKLYINDRFTFIPSENRLTNKIFLKNDDIFLECEVLSDRLIINNICKKEIDNSEICAELYFPFEIIDEKLFNPEYYLNLKEALYDFNSSLSKEFDYQKFLQKNQSLAEEKETFFQKWARVIDRSINEEKYETIFEDYFDSYRIEKDNESERESFLISFVLKSDKYNQVKNTIKKISERNRRVKRKNNFRVNISGRLLKESNYKHNSFYEIGNIKDFNDDELSLVISLDGNPEGFIISPEFSIKLESINFPYPLIQQKRALINFHNDKIKNHYLKNILIAPSIIQPELNPIFKKYIDKEIEWQNKNLTENQKTVIKSALIEKNIFLIQGPPGTGKTTTIKELVYQFLKEIPNSRILIVSQQNVAVDNALAKIYKDDENQKMWFSDNSIEKKSIIRCGNSEKIKDNLIQGLSLEHWFNQYKKDTLDINNRSENFKWLRNEWNQYIDKDDIRDVDNQILEILLKSHQIVGATCVGLAQKSIGLDLLEFDFVIIDEAGRATPPELLIPILKGNKVILIGDHYQLPPSISKSLIDDSNGNISIELGIEKEFLELSLFEYVFDNCPDSNKGKLIDQFRMPENIGNLISKMFYDSELKNGIFDGHVKKLNNSFLFPLEMQWINVNGKQEKDGTSSFNLKEVDRITDLLIEIDKKAYNKNRTIDIAIITPYSAQKKKLLMKKNLLFKEEKLKFLKDENIRIDTVDSFQGSEAEIVIYSTVRTFGNINFLVDKRRLNVAISRTKENLIFVGNKNFMCKDIISKGNTIPNYFKLIILSLDEYEAKTHDDNFVTNV